MNEISRVNGIVLSATPVGDHDKRLVIETCELGKITAFARGCRRAGNALQAAANPFVLGEFAIAAGSSSYRIAEANIREYFRELTALVPDVYIGFYFLELVDYYGREGIDGTEMLNLLYVSCRALLNDKIDNRLVRRIFELRLAAVNGEYAPEAEKMSEGLYSVCRFVNDAPLGRLFSFNINDELAGELNRLSDRILRRTVDRELKSRKIMEMLTDFTHKYG